MARPDDRDPAALIPGYAAGQLTAEEERALFEAASRDQELFNELMEAEALREGFSSAEERRRASEILRAWDRSAPAEETPAAAAVPYHGQEPLWATLLRPAISSFATALAGSVAYAVIKNIGSSLGVPQTRSVVAPALQTVPAILHQVQAAIVALLLGLQFTPFLRPQRVSGEAHPIAQRCLAQFIRGWRWAWVCWLCLYAWLSFHPQVREPMEPITDILNGLTAFPLFWCFLVLDKPSVAVPGKPGRDAAFRQAVATTWGIGVGVIALAIASRLHWWGLGEFGVAFLGIYDGLAIAFLVGRFDSHWMQVPRWMLAPLYGYALIQMIYVFFDQLDPAWSVYTYLVALLLKVCLFFIVTHLLHAGHMRRYLEAAEEGVLGPQSGQ